jgi:hypothetical protein
MVIIDGLFHTPSIALATVPTEVLPFVITVAPLLVAGPNPYQCV